MCGSCRPWHPSGCGGGCPVCGGAVCRGRDSLYSQKGGCAGVCKGGKMLGGGRGQADPLRGLPGSGRGYGRRKDRRGPQQQRQCGDHAVSSVQGQRA